ncbi:MAG: hypothetical protein ACT4N2_10915 [Hyphomicrobium sp.]
MKHSAFASALATVLLAACSGASGLSTGSNASSGATTAAPAAAVSDVTGRALQVGSVSARAQKCGYNFDAVKLRTNFLAAESAINPADVAKAEKVYDIARNGVIKAVATKADYCTDSKTAIIKEDLTRHLAGDFSPRPAKVEAAEPGFFDTWGDGNGNEKGPKFGSENWWESQTEKRTN